MVQIPFSFLTVLLLVVLLLMDVISSFRPVPAVRYSSRVVIARMSLANENAILKIQKEYGQLREKLRQGLLHEGEGVDVDPIAFTQELLEKATDMVALQRYQQEEIIMKAAKELRHARSDHVLADAVQQQAHEEYEMAQEALQQLESFEDSVSGYEDRERLRDMSVAHAASHVEHDARELSLESQFQELEASEKQDRAVEFLHRLEEIEEELHDTLIAVMKFKNEHAMEEWAKNEAPKHEEFLGILNTQFNNMNGDLSS